MRRIALLGAVLALVAASPAAAQDGPLDAAVGAFANDNVFIHPDADPKLTASQAEELRQRISDRKAGPMYVAFLPERVTRQFGGSVDGALSALQQRLGRPGTYVVVAGRTFRAGSTDAPEGATPKAANEAREANAGDIDAILLDFADRMGDVRAGRDSGGVPGFVPLAFLVVVIGGLGLLVTTRVRKQRREQAAQLEEVRGSVREDVVELGGEIRALDLDIQMPGATDEARTDYEQALGAYERASSAVDRVEKAADLEPVGAAVEEGRYAMACARARLDGREPPERRPPCFFDPRHGPSARDVEWSPPYGLAREVPACEADAQRVERGEDPEAREVTLGGRRMPYWDAGPAYAPYMGGFFGGGLLPGLFLGSLLSDGMWGGGFSDPGSGSSGMGDFGGGGGGGGGGDFGGGGGDFGGGDF